MQTNIHKRTLIFFCCLFSMVAFGQTNDPRKQFKGLDEYMEKTLKDWNTPGAGVGIVVKDKLVYAKGYGYRNYGKKLPVTPNTLYQIASNTKLFTSIASGMLVEEGKLDWDKPVRNYIPTIQFYNDQLTSSITIRDMLSHRTGISRHDLIWYKSDFTRKELFDRLKYMEPSQPLRQGFLYNNMMYGAAGYIVEQLSQKSWEVFLKERVFNPLNMKSTVFSIDEMKKQSDHVIPYNEKRDTTLLYEIPLYVETSGVGPAGSIISNINDMSNWLITLMNDGKYNGKQVIPSAAVKATVEPAIAQPNFSLMKGYKEILNPVYGMGRGSVSYRGHLLVNHGGDLPGIHSQVSYMPQDSIGVIVFVIGDQSGPLYNIISYNVFERLLGLELTPWSERVLKEVNAGKKMAREGRQKAATGQVNGTKPSHPLTDYVGQYEHPAYGIINITRQDSILHFALHRIAMPLSHFHYNRFDTPNHEVDGMYSVNFNISPQGEIDRLVISLEEDEATFLRKPDASLSDPKILASYVAKYVIGGAVIDVALKHENQLFFIPPGQPMLELIPYKPRLFRTKEVADLTIEFVEEGNKVTKLKYKDASGEYEMKRQ